MDDMRANFLVTVELQLRTALQPAGGDSRTTQLAQCCAQILARIRSEAIELPRLQADMLAAYSQLLPDLRHALPAHLELISHLERHAHSHPRMTEACAIVQQLIPLLENEAVDAGEALKIMRRLSEIDRIFVRQFDAVIAAESCNVEHASSPDSPPNADQLKRLERLLRSRVSEASQVTVESARVISGGFSKQTLFVELRGTDALPSTVVVRKDKTVSVLGTAVADEYPLVETMHAAGVPVPRPILLDRGVETLGSSFAIFERANGTNIGDPFDVYKPSRAFGVSLAQALAGIHAVDPNRVDMRDGTLNVRQRMREDIKRHEEQWRGFGEPSVPLEMAYSWLRRNIDLADGPAAIIHRDIGCHNLLVEDDRVTAVLDWENATVGVPAQDLGYVYPLAVQLMPWDDFLGEYVQAGGTAPGEAQIRYFRIWREVWLMWTLSQARAALRSGLAGDIGLVTALVLGGPRLDRHLQELLAEVI